MKNRIQIARETLDIIEANEYIVSDKRIVLSNNSQSLCDVVVISPKKVEEALTKLDKNQLESLGEIQVDMFDSLTSAKQNGVGKVLVLNFANGFRPGGGFLNGAIAQEEAICRCSSLYASISSESASEMYAYNKAHVTPEGSDYMLLSPSVVVFRDSECNLLEEPYEISVITSAAPNLYHEAYSLKDEVLDEIMRHKIKNIIAVAAQYSYDTLILGAWGCGAFGHDASRIANCFYDVLVKDGNKRIFKKIVFSILARSENDYNYSKFHERFVESRK